MANLPISLGAKLALAAVAATSVYYFTCPWRGNLIGEWETNKDDYDQVKLLLKPDGTFSGSEIWTGPQSKPGPSYRMTGQWAVNGSSLELRDVSEEGLSCRPPGNPDNLFEVPMVGPILIWGFGTGSYNLRRVAP